ncbi:hypothetical protein HPB51_004028 [Rhipicephalus microplus]|uniref:Uncharacterized protein n=1 Tax=Rhipicephalus microplus TaxID=6941 RepID=A0A9J6EXH2_RHIMP|nr:hypothetical protein HPB51_004028 [Rhipicephalus microplus]
MELVDTGRSSHNTFSIAALMANEPPVAQAYLQPGSSPVGGGDAPSAGRTAYQAGDCCLATDWASTPSYVASTPVKDMEGERLATGVAMMSPSSPVFAKLGCCGTLGEREEWW